MMSQSQKTEFLFSYFRLDDHIPENHLLLLVDRYVDFSFVRERLKDFYSQLGRPSIDPEVLLRLLLVGYLHGITSKHSGAYFDKLPGPACHFPFASSSPFGGESSLSMASLKTV